MKKEEISYPDYFDQLGRRFMYLYTANQSRIYGFIYTLLPNAAHADDVMQETATVLWSKFQDFQPGTNFLAWALSIARYEVIAYRRKMQTRKARFSEATMEKLYDVAMHSMKDDSFRLEALRDCMTRLKEDDKQLLTMRYESGTTIKSIADCLNRNVHTLYKEFRRVHISLLKCIRRSLRQEGIL